MVDRGDVKFAMDLSTGIVTVTVRPPFALPSGAVSSTMSVLDLLDNAARVTLELNKLQRETYAQLRRGELAGAAKMAKGQ